MQSVVIQDRRIAPGQPCFVIAEAGVNHNGDPGLAARLIEAASAAGADAVKFQTFDPAAIASLSAPKAAYQLEADGADSHRAMLERLRLPPEAHAPLKRQAEAAGLVFLSSPFDHASADFLAHLGVAAFKIASGEVTNHPLLAHIAGKRRPVLMSTGMCTLDEVAAAVAVVRAAGDPPLALLHCVSRYPAEPAEANLRAMATMRARFDCPVGWSDHTLGIDVAGAAVALGADLIEKHLTLDRAMPGPDHRASLEPGAFADMVRSIRRVTSALGSGEKLPAPSEAAIAAVARKSLHWRADLAPGTTVTAEHLAALRPGTGLPPSRLPSLVGRRLARPVSAGAAVSEADLDG